MSAVFTDNSMYRGFPTLKLVDDELGELLTSAGVGNYLSLTY